MAHTYGLSVAAACILLAQGVQAFLVEGQRVNNLGCGAI